MRFKRTIRVKDPVYWHTSIMLKIRVQDISTSKGTHLLDLMIKCLAYLEAGNTVLVACLFPLLTYLPVFTAAS